MSLNFISDNPVIITNTDNDIKIELDKSDIVNDGNFNGETHHYTNNINGISIDKYGRVIGVETGVDIVSPNEISYLKINNDDHSYNLQLTKNPETTQTLTINTDDKLNVNLSNNVIELKLNETGVVNKDNVSFDIKTTNASVDGISIKKLTDNNYTNTIDIYKGKTYIFKQNDATSTESNNNLSLHAIGVSKTEHLIEDYSNVEYYINDDGVIYNHNQYRLKFIDRNINSNPYFKFKLPNDFEGNVLYFYSLYGNIQQKITVNIKDVIETKTFKDIKDMTIDNHGRVIEISQNEIPLMSKFNINLNDNNKKSVINGDNLNLFGFDDHINTKLVDNNIILKLEETGIINSLGILPNEFYIVIHDNIVKKNNTLSLDVDDYNMDSFDIHSGYEYIFHQKIINRHPIKIVIDEFAHNDYTDNVDYYSRIENTGEYELVTLDTYKNNINNGNIGYIKLKTNTNTPKKLYLSSANNPNTNVKMSINTNIYTKQFDGVLSITTDQYGRLHDISTIDEINDVSFTVLISDYTVSSFDTIKQRALLEGFVYYFLNIEFNNIFINNIVEQGNGYISIDIKITKISTDKANNISLKLNNLKNNDDIKNNFKLILTNVKNMINFNDISFISDFVITLVDNNSIYINNFTIRAGDSDININNMSILEFNTDDSIINIVFEPNNKKITFDLNQLKDNTVTYTNNIKEITVDKYGRITDVKTGSLELPDSGVTSSNTDETFSNGISSITVNSKGIISNIETVDYISMINAGDELLNGKINNYVSNNNTIVNKLKNDFNLYVSNNNSENIINKSNIQSNINSVTNEILRATSVEGDINLLNTNNKNSLVDAINHLNNGINDYMEYNNSNIKKLDMDLKYDILSISNTFITSLNDFNNILKDNSESIEKIGNLDYYNTKDLMSFLGNLSNVRSTGTLDEQINKIGLLDIYTSNNTLIDDVNNNKIKNIFIDDDITTAIKSYTGHKNLFSILGLNNNSEKYSYGPSNTYQADPFYRDGFYPLFTTLENMSVWKNINIIGVINKALTRVNINSIDYVNLLNFKNNFKDLSISPNEVSDIQHTWNTVQDFEQEDHVYFTIGHNLFSDGENPTITFTNKYNIQETITIEIDNKGNSKKNILNDIIKLEYKTKKLESNLETLKLSNNVFVKYFKKLVNSYVKFDKSDILSSYNTNVHFGYTIINANDVSRITDNKLYVNSYIVDYNNTWLVPLNTINPTVIIDVDLSNFTDGFTLFFQMKNFKGNVDNLFTIISQEQESNNTVLHKTVYSITDNNFIVNSNTARFDSDFKNVDTGVNTDDKSIWNVFISFIPDLTTVTYNEFDEKIYTSYKTQLIYKKSNSDKINYSKKLDVSIHHLNKSWLLFGQSSKENINGGYVVDNGINDINNWVNGNVNSYNADHNIDCNCDISNILIFDKKIDIKDIYNFNKLNTLDLEQLF
tara:strand:- start:5033 stop:9343 length:4311 start_codon:yes stop_codon:yes gene_type:complete